MSVLVEPARPALSLMRTFIRSWDAGDRHLRFGSACDSAGQWLIDAFEAGGHDGLVARENGDLVALLDFVRDEREMEFGVFVDARHRRCGLGRTLVETLLARCPPQERVVAHCRRTNAAAVALLWGTGFTLEAESHGECRWARCSSLVSLER
jgi:ribosomal protein S18 acetylase RimI-like enzyme